MAEGQYQANTRQKITEVSICIPMVHRIEVDINKL